MNDERPRPSRDDAYWQDFLTHPDSFLGFGRRVLGRIPAGPRCRLCAAPFAGPGGPVMRMLGKGPSTANPNVCSACQNELMRHHGGAEVEGSMLFADIRGSTAMAETMSPAEFRTRLDRFYTTATDVVVEHDGMVDKFVGDELVAVFAPLFSEVPHAERAVRAAESLLERTGHRDDSGPWVPLGAGVHTGKVWFGTIGEGSHVEITVVGDAVNVAARLAAQAESGEVLVSVEAALQAGLDAGLERTSLELKGKQEPTEVVILHVGR